MTQRKTLQQQVDDLRGEIAALRAERAVQRAEASAKAAKPAPVPAPEAAEKGVIGKGGELERALAELLETTEHEIAEHPALVAGLAFLAGVAVGRMSKG